VSSPPSWDLARSASRGQGGKRPVWSLARVCPGARGTLALGEAPGDALLASKGAPPPVYAPYLISEISAQAQAQADGQQYGLNITITTKSS
jgi:hypothetical protein